MPDRGPLLDVCVVAFGLEANDGDDDGNVTREEEGVMLYWSYTLLGNKGDISFGGSKFETDGVRECDREREATRANHDCLCESLKSVSFGLC